MSEQLKFALDHLIFLRSLNQISKIEFQEELNIVHTSFIHLFNSENIDKSDPTKNLIYKKKRSVKEYYKRIQSHSKNKMQSKDLYNLYTYYSKYDHFGSMTHFLQTDNIAFNLTRILISLENMIFGFDESLNTLYSPVDIFKKEKEVLETLKNQFENLIK